MPSRTARKARDYARGGVPVYWLLDLEARALEVSTDPDPDTAPIRSLGAEEAITLPEIDVTWRVRSLLS